MDKGRTLSFLGLMKKAGRLEIGEESVTDSADRGSAQLILSAADASGRSRRSAAIISESRGVPLIILPFSKDELGAVLGRGSPGMLAVTDIGFAAGLAEIMAAEEPEKYGDIADRLHILQDRIRKPAAASRSIGKRRS